MPALEVFGRRSRVVGSDDLFFPALLLFLHQLPLTLVCILFSCLWRGCSSTSLNDRGLPFWYMLGAAPLFFFRGCIYLMIMHVSAKGTIVNHERRVLMPKMLQVHTLWSILLMGYGIAGIWSWYSRDMCNPDARFVLAVGGFLVAEVIFTTCLGLCMLGEVQLPEAIDFDKGLPASASDDPFGNVCVSERQSLLDELSREGSASTIYVPHSQQLWHQRCTRCCMCIRCFTCNLFGGAGTRHDSMSVVAKVFSRLFYGNPDLVISDIVAGFILLAAVQAYEEHQEVLATSLHDEEEESKKHRASFQASASKPKTLHDAVTINTGIVNTSNIDQSSHVVSIDVPSSNDADARFQHANKTFYYHPADPHLRDVELIGKLQEMAHYSKYAIGIYGWMLYVWSHPWSGTFRLAFSCLRRHVSYVHGDNWFHLSQTALQLETKLHRDDIVYASFQNSVYQPAFAVMLDHKQQDVVIAIRGTLSLEDCLTDVMAYGMSMDDIARRWHCDGVGEFAHQGFLTCAEAIYLELNRLGILDMLFDHNSMTAIATHHVQECERGLYRHYGLVITGHSLGAGAACLLAVLMRSKYPRVRCFAFSPPGCTMSRGLASRCALFTNSVVVGDDIIARSSLTSAEALRDHVLDLIGRSKVNKTAILRQVLSWRHPDDLLHQNTANHSAMDANVDGHSPFVAHLLNYRTMLKRIQESEPIHELTIPGRVVHLKRVVQAKRAAGCWVCCRFGGGGMCCTARTKYRFAWAAAGQFSRIRIGRTMLDDHFPDKVHYVLQDCVQRMQTRKPQYD